MRNIKATAGLWFAALILAVAAAGCSTPSSGEPDGSTSVSTAPGSSAAAPGY